MKVIPAEKRPKARRECAATGKSVYQGLFFPINRNRRLLSPDSLAHFPQWAAYRLVRAFVGQ